MAKTQDDKHLDVFTLQNAQPLVHVSPMIMIVAVAVPFFPPQHSPIFGHFASTQTVERLRDFKESRSIS